MISGHYLLSEDPSKYHQYRITGDFNNIESYVNQTPDAVLREKVTTLMDAYDLTYDDLKIQKGDIAPGFGSTGGGIQYEMPLPVDLLEGFRLSRKNKIRCEYVDKRECFRNHPK